MIGTADSVLIREVSLIHSVLYIEVPLYLSIEDTIGTQLAVLYREVSLIQR